MSDNTRPIVRTSFFLRIAQRTDKALFINMMPNLFTCLRVRLSSHILVFIQQPHRETLPYSTYANPGTGTHPHTPIFAKTSPFPLHPSTTLYLSSVFNLLSLIISSHSHSQRRNMSTFVSTSIDLLFLSDFPSSAPGNMCLFADVGNVANEFSDPLSPESSPSKGSTTVYTKSGFRDAREEVFAGYPTARSFTKVGGGGGEEERFRATPPITIPALTSTPVISSTSPSTPSKSHPITPVPRSIASSLTLAGPIETPTSSHAISSPVGNGTSFRIEDCNESGCDEGCLCARFDALNRQALKMIEEGRECLAT